MRTLESICQQLVLDQTQCKLLETLLPQVCPPCAKEKGEAGIKERKRSRWQECISKRYVETAQKLAPTPEASALEVPRRGRLNPQVIKQLAKEYHEGKCP